MINALYEPFPETIEADGREYRILTDFREWLKFADMVQNKELTVKEKLLLMIQWLEEVPEIITGELVNAVIGFYKATALEPDPPEDEEDEDDEPDEAAGRPPLLDWKYDAKYIIGDFRRCYGIDLLTVEYMHWWEFRCLFAALPEDAVTQRRIAYRSVDTSQIKNDAERRRILRIQQQIAIPFELDDDAIASALGGMML